MMNVLHYIPQLLSGTAVTLQLMVVALALGLCLALLLTACLESGKIYLKAPIDAFVFAIRGTPLLAQFFIIYYGSGQLFWLRETFLWSILKHPFGCAVIALALNTSAYTAVLFRGAIHSVPQGEIEACYALGLSKWQMYRRIILPRAFRIVLPAYSNEVIMILKSTSLASTITLMDLMGVTRHIIALNFETIPMLILAGIIYLLLNGIVMGVFTLLERKLSMKHYSIASTS